MASAYREAGYDFILLSDHFEARYGWSVTDTSGLRTPTFTTIIGAELSSAAWDERTVYWVTAAGLPVDFEPPPSDDHAEAITRAVDGLPGFEAIDAVEIYNHNTAQSHPEREEGAYMADGLLENGHRLLLNAGDDAHFLFDADRFGGWVEVHAEALDPDALLDALKAGSYYSTQGPRLERLELDGNRLNVATSEVVCISLGGGGDRWQAGTEERANNLTQATFDLEPFRGSYCRVTAIDAAGRRAWSNPVWP